MAKKATQSMVSTHPTLAPDTAPTTQKSVRVTPQIAQRIKRIAPAVPNTYNEAAVLSALLGDGLHLREAAVVAAGGDLPPGIDLPVLLVLVASSVQPVLPLLVQHGYLVGLGGGTLPLPPPLAPAPPLGLDASAADDMNAMGASLL